MAITVTSVTNTEISALAVCQVDDHTPLHQLFMAAPCSSWSSAAVGPCLRYAWGSPLKSVVPSEWAEFNNLAMNKFPMGYYRPMNG